MKEEMENTPEAFQAMIEKTVEKKVSDYKDSLNTPVAKQFLEYVENGGDPGQFFQLVSAPIVTGKRFPVTIGGGNRR